MEPEMIQIEIPELESAPTPAPAPPTPPRPTRRASDEKPAAEYALHILFTQFVRYTERKLNEFDSETDNRNIRIEEMLGEGADPEFDKILVSLGHVARRKPKPVIDSVMYWRKSKSDQAASAMQSRSQTEHVLAERRSMVSIFILSRVLMEVVRQTPPDVLGDDLSEKLEDIVFRQLLAANPEAISSNSIRRANWMLLSWLLGEMSAFRFASVDDKFISELEKVPLSLSRPQEAHTELLIQAMKHLKIKLYPEENLEESANFFESIAKFYRRTTSLGLRDNYSDVLCTMFEPIAEVSTVEVNHPVWASTIETMYGQAVETMKKSWGPAFNLAAMSLCVSPKNVFADNWMPLLETQLAKLKGKWSSRSPQIYVAAARLLWVLVFRCTESLNSTTRKLEAMRKLLFNVPRKTWQSFTPLTSNASVFTIRSAFQGYQQHTLDEIMFPLLVGNDATEVTRHPSVSPDAIVPERAIVAVRAFIMIMIDLTGDNKPPFPTIERLVGNLSIDVSTAKALPSMSKTLKESVDLFGNCLGQISIIVDHQLQEPSEESVSRQNSVTQLVNLNTHRPVVGSVELMTALIQSFAWWGQDNFRYLEVLCRNISNRSSALAQASAESLKQLARLGDIRQLMSIYTKFLFGCDSRLYTSYELPGGIDLLQLLRVYVDLVEIWVSRLNQGEPGFTEASKDMLLNSLWSMVEELEGHGLFFLCSQDQVVRTYALRILWLTTEMDKAIDSYSKTANPAPGRIIDFLEKLEIVPLVKASLPRLELSVPERSRLNKFKTKKGASVARLADSDYGVDSAIWLKLFPKVMSLCFDQYPMPVAICRNVVCSRLVGMHDVVVAVTEQHARALQSQVSKHPVRTHAETVVEQWRVYLMVVCTTLTATDEQKLHVPQSSQLGHGRKKSMQRVTFHHQRITSIRSVFKILIPLLRTSHQTIVDSVTSGISFTNVNTYKVLLECCSPVLQVGIDELRRGIATGLAPSSLGSAQRTVAHITHILLLTAHHLRNDSIRNDEWICAELVSVIEQLKIVLRLRTIQVDYNYLALRRYFCGLLAEVVEYLNPSSFSFDQREDLRQLIDSWSPYGTSGASAAEVDGIMRRAVLAGAKEPQEHNMILASLEYDRRKFDVSASRALAALMKEQFADERFNNHIKWIHTLLSTSNERLQETGRKSLSNLLSANLDSHLLLEEVVSHCYHNSERSRTNANHYFTCLVGVLVDSPDAEIANGAQLLALALFKIGDYDVNTRENALKLLRVTEGRLYGGSVVSEYQYRLRSSTPSVFKREIFRISGALAKARPQETYAVLSQLTKVFHGINHNDRRDILSVLLPWLHNIEFSPANTGMVQNGASFDTYLSDPAANMVLANLLEITVSFSDTIQNEVEAFWVSLCTGPHGTKNVDVVMNFLFYVCLSRRSPALIMFSSRVFVCLSQSAAVPLLVNHLLQFLEPKWMISQSLRTLDITQAYELYPYVADLSNVVITAEAAMGNNKPMSSSSIPAFSFAQLAVIFMLDNLTSQEELLPHLPTVLHICLTLADHFVPIVQEKVRRLLVNIISLYKPDNTPEVEDYVEKIAGNQAVHWPYDDMSSTIKAGSVTAPEGLVKLVKHTVAQFMQAVPDIQRQWALEAIKWATTCPVRHVACRSFQIYRCLFVQLDQRMLADTLARLSTTVAETSPDIQGFSLQILMTLNAVVDQLTPQTLFNFPQLFWVTVASLGTTNEREYIESLSIMSKILTKWDFTTEETINALRLSFPARWEGEFQGVMQLALLGLRSENAYDQSQEVLLLLLQLVPNDLLLDEDYMALALAANLPRFLHAMETKEIASCAEAATILEALFAGVAPSLARIMNSFTRGRFWSKNDFLQQSVSALCAAFPLSLSSVLLVLMGTLSNRLPWVKTETMAILRLVLPHIDQTDPRLSGLGADIVSPLLRLLQTDFAEQALEVLDEAGSIVAGQMDKHILRMSLGTKQLVKEYEKTATLYGIPEDSGWSVSMPAVTATITRNNVHAVFYTCDTSMVAENESPTAFEFQGEDDYGEYVVPLDRTDSIMTQPDGLANMDRVLTALDDLDVFFTNVNGHHGERPRHVRHDSSAPTESSISESVVERNESIPQLYDKKVSLILNRSLARTPSSVSFRATLDDSFGGSQLQGPSSSHSFHNAQNSIGSNVVTPTSSYSGRRHLRGPSSTGTYPTLLEDDESTSRLWLQRSRSPASSPRTPSTSKHTGKSAADDSPSPSQKPSQSSFRLESLLRGKRRSRKTDGKDKDRKDDKHKDDKHKDDKHRDDKHRDDKHKDDGKHGRTADHGFQFP